MSDKKWTVYCHTNKINGKKYVGITSTEPLTRWKNGQGYKGQKFYNAILKYGWKNFEHEILYIYDTEEEADQKEIELISKLKLTEDKYGYNVSFGGQKTTLGYKHTEETKRKISQKNIDYNKNYNIDRSKDKNTMACRVTIDDIVFGSVISCSEYLKVKPNKLYDMLNGNTYMSLDYYYRKLRWIDKDNNNIKIKKPKFLFNDVFYYTTVDFEKDYGVNRHTLARWYSGKTAVPKIWIELGLKIYSDDFKILQKNKVIKFNGEIFNSLKEFSEYCGIPTVKISKWISGEEEMPLLFKKFELKEL